MYSAGLTHVPPACSVADVTTSAAGRSGSVGPGQATFKWEIELCSKRKSHQLH